mgnify:CR=1 FL=1
MAILKLGAIATELKGKLGGSALQMQGGRCVAFKKSRKSHSSSYSQLTQRSLFGMGANYWKQTTASVRSLYNKMALLRYSEFGYSCSKQLSGRQLYIRSCLLRLRVYNFAINYDPFLYPPPLNLDYYITGSVSPQSLYLRYTKSLPIYCRWALYVSRPYKTPNAVRKGDFKFVYISARNQPSPANIRALVTKAIGRFPVAGERLYFRIYTFNDLSGLYGCPFTCYFDF